MVRKLGFLGLMLGLALPVWSASGPPGVISGFVRNASGAPQMGAMVEFLGPAAPVLTSFTDERGFYSAADLLPGTYSIRVSAVSFLPTLRENVILRAGGKMLVNVTLNTLFDAVKMVPLRGPNDDDDWKWVLRSSSNRPILRILDDNNGTLVAEQQKGDHDLKGNLSFVAGSASEGFGSTAESTTFAVERSIFSSDTVGLAANVGYGTASPASVVRASFSHKMDDGSQPQVALTLRNLPAPFTMPSANLQAFSLTTSDTFALGDTIEFNFGSELQTIQFLGRVTAFRPFGSADYHVSPNTVVEYRYATSEPDSSIENGFTTAPADLSDSQPRVTMVGYASAIEHAHHHELSVSRRMGNTKLQLAAFYDRVVDPALTGVGDIGTEDGMVLPDIYSGTFTYQGNDLKTEGVRLVLQHKLNDNLTTTLDFESGGTLNLERSNISVADAQNYIGTRNRHSVAAKLNGTVPKTKTRWIASYRWIDGHSLTPVDMFNASAGRADPYLNLFIRQPLPGLFPGHVEAVVDLRNLLAEGYVPLLGHDGHTVYLVQSARAVRGGVNFTF